MLVGSVTPLRVCTGFHIHYLKQFPFQSIFLSPSLNHSRPAQMALLPIPLFSDWRVRKIRIVSEACIVMSD